MPTSSSRSWSWVTSHGALELLERDVERVDRFEVQVIRRLVEDEHVGLVQHDPAEQQPRGFASRQRLGRLEPFLAAEQHLTEQPVDFFPRRIGIELVQPFDGGHPLPDAPVCPAGNTQLTLRVPSGSIRCPGPRATPPVRRIREQRLEHRRLAGAVASDQHDFSPRLTMALNP